MIGRRYRPTSPREETAHLSMKQLGWNKKGGKAGGGGGGDHSDDKRKPSHGS